MQTYNDFLDNIIKYDLDILEIHSLKLSFSYSNGCGAKGGVRFPSTIWFVNIEAACNLHDIRWKEAHNYQDLLDANEQFDNDLKKICDSESLFNITRWLRRLRIAKYVSGVELYGTESYAQERGFDRRS